MKDSNVTDQYQRMIRASNDLEEFNDCAVSAVATATGATYQEAHDVFLALGRRLRRPASWYWIERALNELGFRMEDVSAKYPKAKTAISAERELPTRGIFLLGQRSHVACHRAGAIHDWSRGRRKVIRRILRVTRL